MRRIAEFLAPELAKQRYMPTKEPKDADLLIVVHWGTTIPRVTADSMRAKEVISLDNQLEKDLHSAIVEAELAGPNHDGMAAWLQTGSEADREIGYDQVARETDALDNDFNAANNSQLLGYSRELRKFKDTLFSTETEAMMRHDLAGERYFIILRAYDLHEKMELGRTRRAVWSLYLNMRSPGNNFVAALGMMGTAAVDYFGRDTDGVKTARPGDRAGSVNLGPLIILGEVK